MSADEIWDLVDAGGVSIGRTHRRGDPEWPAGAFHVVACVCVVDADGRVLMTRRAAAKDHPLTWEFPAGSALAGESSAEAAVRELEEEAGVVVRADGLHLVGRFVEETALFDLYLARVGREVVLTLDPEEVHEGEWVSVSRVEERYRGGAMAGPWTPRLDAMWDDLAEALTP